MARQISQQNEKASSRQQRQFNELIKDLNKQAKNQQRQIDWINIKLEKTENSGFTRLNKEQILAESKSLI